MGDFAESLEKRQARANAARFHEQALDVVLDDRNISRAAFELSISRLYGGGPPLYIHPSLLPTSTRPLTTGFPYPPEASLSSSQMCPPGHQPGTPEFLVSLLATSIYFSIPSLASEALTAILRTIGPRTVVYYLHFALGKTTVLNLDRPAVGLEGLAVELEQQDHASVNSVKGARSRLSSSQGILNRSPSSLSCASGESFLSSSKQHPFHYGPISDKIGETCACWLEKWGADLFEAEEKVVLDWLSDSNTSVDSLSSGSTSIKPRPSSDLPPPSRSTTSAWTPQSTGTRTKSIPRLFTGTAAGPGYEGLSLDWILVLLSSNGFFIPSPSLHTSLTVSSMHSPPDETPITTSHAHFSAYPEEERYALAKRVVELRRAVRAQVKRLQRKLLATESTRKDDDPDLSEKGKGKERASEDKLGEEKCIEEEEHWDIFFRTSIYYANMSSEIVMSISDDVSPSNGRTFVDLSTLQQAFWDTGKMKFTITGGNDKSHSPNSSHPEKLGFVTSASEMTPTSLSNTKPYFLVPSDESLRVGDTITNSSAEGNIHNNISMDELFENSFGEAYLRQEEDREGTPRRSGTIGKASTGKRWKEPAPDKTVTRGRTPNENTYFGLLSDICYVDRTDESGLLYFTSSPFTAISSPGAISAPLPPVQLLSSRSPLRFSVEFFNVETLKEKERLHSRTVWYAGSLWNVYVQLVKKKEKAGSVGASSPDSDGVLRTGAPGSGILPNYQLGVYLHRHSPTENLPPFSAPDPFAADRQWSQNASPQTPTSGPDTTSSPTPNAPSSQTNLSSSRGPAFLPLTPYASAPQVVSSPVSASRSSSSNTSTNSRFRGNSTSIPVSASLRSPSRPSTAPGSTPSSPTVRSRTPGGSGGWRSLGPTHSNSPVNPSSSGNSFLSSSLPTVFPTFGRTRHQSSGSRDGSRRNIEYGIPSASASSPYVGQPNNPPPSPSTPTQTSPTAGVPSSPTSPTTIPNPPFHAIISDTKPTYPYIDPREVVSVYFSVNCASLTGNAQTRFRSAPDMFKLDGSWGWKSSGLLDGPKTRVSNVDGDVEAALIQIEDELPPMGHYVSLRATVVLGVV
ncbi:hypothetical protein GYMLUDRAFT_267441 [Collybiopsis luxurians FD-317 M1]|nr:hypothetical protein GYMLUDRAFT_267441 [Collybiopsis luxurians FD-317 M1]